MSAFHRVSGLRSAARHRGAPGAAARHPVALAPRRDRARRLRLQQRRRGRDARPPRGQRRARGARRAGPVRGPGDARAERGLRAAAGRRRELGGGGGPPGLRLPLARGPGVVERRALDGRGLRMELPPPCSSPRRPRPTPTCSTPSPAPPTTATGRSEPTGPASGIRARDPRTLELELLSTAPLLEILSHPAFVPVHRGELERAQETHPGTWQVEWLRPEQLVVNGPFRIRERRVNDRLRLASNAAYWDRDNVAFETIDVLAVEHLGTALNLYLTGEIDWLDGTIPPELVDTLRPREDFPAGPTSASTSTASTSRGRRFDDVRVRRALRRGHRPRSDRREAARRQFRAPRSGMTPATFKGYSPPRLVPLIARASARRCFERVGLRRREPQARSRAWRSTSTPPSCTATSPESSPPAGPRPSA